MYIKVRVKTGQRKETLEERSATDFVLSVREKAERNMANKRVIGIFQDRFGTKKVRIISGIRHPIKMLAVDL